MALLRIVVWVFFVSHAAMPFIVATMIHNPPQMPAAGMALDGFFGILAAVWIVRALGRIT